MHFTTEHTEACTEETEKIYFLGHLSGKKSDSPPAANAFYHGVHGGLHRGNGENLFPQ